MEAVATPEVLTHEQERGKPMPAIESDQEKLFYKLWFKLDNSDGYLLWLSGEHDSLFLDEGFIPAFKTNESLYNFAKSRTLAISDEERTYYS